MPGQNENIFWGPPPAAAEVPTELLYVHVRYIQTKDTPPKTIRRRCKGKKKGSPNLHEILYITCHPYGRLPCLCQLHTSRWLGGGSRRILGDFRGRSACTQLSLLHRKVRCNCRGRRRVLRRWWISQAPCVFSAPVPPGDPHRRPGPGAADVFGRPRAGDLPLPATRCPPHRQNCQLTALRRWRIGGSRVRRPRC